MTHQIIKNTVSGSLKLIGLPERMAFTSWRDFVRQMPELFDVEVPNNVLGVVFTDTNPSEDERDKIWVNRKANGEIPDLRLFRSGKWKVFYTFAPGQIIEVYGDSQNYEFDNPDFKVILVGDDVVPPDVVLSLMATYHADGLGGYSKFAVRYNPQ